MQHTHTKSINTYVTNLFIHVSKIFVGKRKYEFYYGSGMTHSCEEIH